MDQPAHGSIAFNLQPSPGIGQAESWISSCPNRLQMRWAALSITRTLIGHIRRQSKQCANPFVHYLKKRRKGEAHEKDNDSGWTAHSPRMSWGERSSDIFQDGHSRLFKDERPVSPMLRNEEVKPDATPEDAHDIEHIFPAVWIERLNRKDIEPADHREDCRQRI